MKILFTASARRQFLEGLEYIRQDSPTAARRFRERVEAALGRLSEFPDSGRAIPEFPELPHREVVVREYAPDRLLSQKGVGLTEAVFDMLSRYV